MKQVAKKNYTSTLVISWVLYAVGILFNLFLFASFGIGLVMARRSDNASAHSFKVVWIVSLVTLLAEFFIGLLFGIMY